MEQKYINISDLLRKVKHGRKTIAIYIGIFTIIGLAMVLSTPRRYRSIVLLAPEQVATDEERQDAIFPEIYPNIIGSTDFVLNLLAMPVTTADGTIHTDYQTWLSKHQKHAISEYPKMVVAAILEKVRGANNTGGVATAGPVRLSKRDEDLIRSVHSNIRCVWDKKTDAITLSVVDQDALVAALVADSVTSRLQKSITDYRTAKSRVDLEYAERVYNMSKEEYEAATDAYSTYQDAYQSATLESYKLRAESLRRDLELKYTVYCDANERLLLARMRLQEQTPAFCVLQNATVAGKPIGASRAIRLMLWLILGTILGCCHVWTRDEKSSK